MTCTTTCVQPSPSNAHCAACHRTFGSVSGFDRHRRGGECVDPATIGELRLTDRGLWRFEGGQNRADAHSALRIQPESAETGSLVGRDTPATFEAAQTISGSPSPLRATLPDERAVLVPASTLEHLEAS